jgi:hypothetical protein
VLGKGQVVLGETSTLKVASFDNLAALTTFFTDGQYFTKGVLETALGSGDTTTKPSDLVKIPGISATKGLKVTATSAETTTTPLTIPAGADITAVSGDTFATVTGLDVVGSLTLDPAATLAAATSITVSGTLDLGVNTAFTTAASGLAIETTGTGVIKSATATPGVLSVLLGNAKADAKLNIEQGGAGVTLTAGITVQAGTTLTLTGATGSITTGSSAELTVKGTVVAGDLVIDGAGDATGITTTYTAGVAVSAANGLSIGAGDIITIPANASINLGGDTGITLGAGTYKSEADATKIGIDNTSKKPTLTFGGTAAATFNVGAAAAEGGLLTVGSASAIVGAHSDGDKVFTKNTEAAPLATKLLVDIAASATIKEQGGSGPNTGGITLADGTIAEKAADTVLGVDGTTGLKLISVTEQGTTAWEAATTD